MLCRDKSLIAQGLSGGAAIPVKCRSWTCDYCQPMRRRQLIAQGIDGNPNRFITITCRFGQYETANKAAKAMAQAWRTIVQRWRRKRKRNKCEYLVVFEATKRGWPHMHILWRGAWLDIHWLKAQTTALLNSPSVFIRKTTTAKQDVAYAAIYCGKANHKFGTSKRYWMTPGYRQSKPTDAPKDFPKSWAWTISDETTTEIAADWTRLHRFVFKLKPDAIAWGHWLYDDIIHDRPRPSTFKERQDFKERQRYERAMAEMAEALYQTPPLADTPRPYGTREGVPV